MEQVLHGALEFLFSVAHAQSQSQIYLEPTLEAVSAGSAQVPVPGLIIRNIYNFSLMLGGILAFGMIVFGAVKYTMSGGNPSGQSDARSIVTQALLGLLLLMSAFIVLNLINPELTGLNLPELGKIQAVREGQLPDTTVVEPGLTQENAMTQLKAWRVEIAGPINLAGIRQTTVDEVISLKQMCNCEVVVTSATGGQHVTSGQFNHASGYKVDLRVNDNLNNFIMGRYTELRPRRNGDRVFQAPSGALYVWETNRPANPLPGWAPHWDVQVIPGGW